MGGVVHIFAQHTSFKDLLILFYFWGGVGWGGVGCG